MLGIQIHVDYAFLLLVEIVEYPSHKIFLVIARGDNSLGQ